MIECSHSADVLEVYHGYTPMLSTLASGVKEGRLQSFANVAGDTESMVVELSPDADTDARVLLELCSWPLEMEVLRDDAGRKGFLF